MIISSMIPKKILKLLLDDPFTDGCCYKGCGALPQLHHAFQYSDKSIQKVWNIVPACPEHHAQATPHNNKYKKTVRYYFELEAIKRMTDYDVSKYPKMNWTKEAEFLIKHI